MDGVTDAENNKVELTREFLAAEDPAALFESWLADAGKTEPSDPNAMTVATVDKEGLPNARILLLKGHSPEGFVFYTNSQSAKGDELLTTPKAAICFHWKTLGRQVRARGPVSPVSPEEADTYFATRSRGSRLGAWASQQSRPMAGREVLEQAVKEMEKKHEGQDVPRPPHWLGYRLKPLEIEFWCNGDYRLHDRVRFYRDSTSGVWEKSVLYP